MEEANLVSLEMALAKTEEDVNSAIKAAAVALSALKRFRSAIKTGSLRELRKTIESSENAVAALRQQFVNAKDGWDFNEETYFSGRAFISEILETADKMGLKIFEQDEILFCYPFLVRILPNERTVLIDKTREKRLRPSVLINHLKELQNKPVRFRPDAFLESLFSAYTMIIKTRSEDKPGMVTVIPLIKIYNLLTLLPGQTRDYTIQEFARDIYLLDQSRITTTKAGFIVGFHASTATKSLRGTIRVITKDGLEKKYYGISFSAG